MCEPVLAQYTIRSKQAYIFRTNRLAEIDGASRLIGEALKNLLSFARTCGFQVRDVSSAFSLIEICGDFANKRLDLVELFIGGGNATFLFRDRETYARLNRRFTRMVLEQYPGMIPMCVAVPAGLVDYNADYKALMAATETEKNRMIPGRAGFALPFAMMDRSTFQPLSHVWLEQEQEWRRTDEAVFKLMAGRQTGNATPDNNLLDKLVIQKDEESLLAIVHADGNNMGIKIQNKLNGHSEYDFCVNAMRDFTREIDKVFSQDAKDAVDKRAAKAREEKYLGETVRASAYEIRWVVYDGDDVTFICNARLAKLLAETYLQAVDSFSGKEKYSSCAGICIFHSHYPFSRAYALAEQACDSAKDPVHKSRQEACWLDFHYHRSGVGGDLERIRERRNLTALLARPYRVCGAALEPSRGIDRIDALAKLLQSFHVARSNIKTLGAALEEDRALGEREWARICYNTDGLEQEVNQQFPDDTLLFRLLYDLSEVYDLWYQKEV